MSEAKTILVTGASSGVGQAVAAKFAREGWNVVASMRNPEVHPHSTIKNVTTMKMDVTVKSSISDAVAEIQTKFGNIDLLINNAGYGEFGVFEGISDERIRANFDVNVFGVMDVMRSVIPLMRQRRSGTIINVSSGGGIIGLPSTAVYLSTKFALEGFTESIWYELDAVGIRAKLVEPGGIETPFIQKIAGQAARNAAPLEYAQYQARISKRMGELNWKRSTADEIAEVVWGAATDESSQLRYFYGPGIAHLIASRRTAGEPEYERTIRGEFGYA